MFGCTDFFIITGVNAEEVIRSRQVGCVVLGVWGISSLSTSIFLNRKMSSAENEDQRGSGGRYSREMVCKSHLPEWESP